MAPKICKMQDTLGNSFEKVKYKLIIDVVLHI